MSINTFLCKWYKKDTVTLKDLLSEVLFVSVLAMTSILYIKGAIFIYQDCTTTSLQPATMTFFEAFSVMFCWVISGLSGVAIVFVIIGFLTVHVMDIKIASCKRGNQK